MGGVVAYFLLPYMVALITGTIFALVLSPLHKKWRTHKLGPRQKAAIITLGFAFAFLIPFGLALYSGVASGLETVKQFKLSHNGMSGALAKGDTHAAIQRFFDENPNAKETFQKLPISQEKTLQLLERGLDTIGKTALGLTQKLLASVPSVIFNAIIILATIFFALADGARGRRYIESNPIFPPIRTREITQTFEAASFSIVVAAVISGLCQASVLVLASFVAGKGSPLLIGVVTFFCSFVPLIGTMPVSIFLILSQMVQGEPMSAVIFLVFALMAAVVDNLVVPWIVGDHTRIHPLIIFVSVFGAIEMIGVYGLFVGPVMTVTFLKLLEVLSSLSLHSDAREVQTDSFIQENGTPQILFSERN